MSNKWKDAQKSTEIVYSGDRIIQRILEELGTTKNIAKNPYVIEKVVIILYGIMMQRDFKISGVNVRNGMVTGECGEKEIDQIVELLRNNEEKAEKTLDDKKDKSCRGTEYRISIDSSTQELTLLTVMFSPPYSKEQVIKDTFRDLEREGEEGVGETIERREGWQKTKINPDGIVMQRKWNEEPGVTAIKMRRMPNDPIIIEVTGFQTGIKYFSMSEPEQIPNLMGNTTNFFPGILKCLSRKYEMKDSPEEVRRTDRYKNLAGSIEDVGKFGRYGNGIDKLNEYSRLPINRFI